MSEQKEHVASAPLAGAERCSLTAMVLTRNEAGNIGPCLASLEWVDDVVLADSLSGDGTVEAARAARPDIRVVQRAFTDFGDQRNWALEAGAPRHPWVLFLDADERSTPAFAAAVRRVVSDSGEKVGFYLTSHSHFLGRRIDHVALYPSWQLRLLRAGAVRFRAEGHGQREVTDGPLGYLREPYLHYGFSKGLEHWIARHNRYSSDEVALILRLRREPLRPGDLFAGPVPRRRCLKRLAARLPARPLLRGLYLYVLRRGFLDGYAGWVFTSLRVAQEIHITAKLAEARAREREGATP